MATIVPKDGFDAEELCEGLRKAMKGFGTDEKAIIEILCSVDNAQRQELKHKFKGTGTDEAQITEILASRSNEEIAAIVESYKEQYNRTLEEDISSENGGHLKRIYISLLQGARPDDDGDEAQAVDDAKVLFEAGEKSWGTDESEFNRIFMTRSPKHLALVAEEYKKLSDYTLRRAVEKEMSGNFEFAMVTLIQTAVDMPGYFAERIHRAVDGMGTADQDLIRVFVTRSEKDLAIVDERYKDMYGKGLAPTIKDEIGGDYKRLLLHILKAE
ncbi:uncharacterized protein MONBRDRAFT_37066 [Monosiga brevicollis MX1]|uniref:Annexin n=1 Tax=Monosiga brevicollis TaxID=81824 RepID=A9UZE1_MONBE|nr:uncharacterized protein MONBRDRAFT_37066 [Monosiga brevicollis MX1]EDQ89215.1 predicted protein [Monosiga brevicollis MX1]|eukprot:XP_001745791.1 hypothetical protein [Monosiga brevicollis MX1]